MDYKGHCRAQRCGTGLYAMSCLLRADPECKELCVCIPRDDEFPIISSLCLK